jgi:hypothetical protein
MVQKQQSNDYHYSLIAVDAAIINKKTTQQRREDVKQRHLRKNMNENTQGFN